MLFLLQISDQKKKNKTKLDFALKSKSPIMAYFGYFVFHERFLRNLTQFRRKFGLVACPTVHTIPFFSKNYIHILFSLSRYVAFRLLWLIVYWWFAVFYFIFVRRHEYTNENTIKSKKRELFYLMTDETFCMACTSYIILVLIVVSVYFILAINSSIF